jgi:hypothetical protein
MTFTVIWVLIFSLGLETRRRHVSSLGPKQRNMVSLFWPLVPVVLVGDVVCVVFVVLGFVVFS